MDGTAKTASGSRSSEDWEETKSSEDNEEEEEEEGGVVTSLPRIDYAKNTGHHLNANRYVYCMIVLILIDAKYCVLHKNYSSISHAENIFYRCLSWIHTTIVFERPIHSPHLPGT